MLKRVSQLVRQARNQFTGESIEYTYQDTDESVIIRVTRGSSGQPMDGADRLRLPSGQLDWLIGRSVLSREPKRGDKILASGVSYQVVPFDDREECWVPSDNYRDTFRVHSKLMETADD